MFMSPHYQFGLLCLTHLLISADGVIEKSELDALQVIKEREKISQDVFDKFEQTVRRNKERDIFQAGIDALNLCTTDEKLRAFVTLYKLSEVDGRVHLKEIRLLLYSIKHAGVEFDHVVSKAMTSPSLL
jgi:hypothetical protein